MFREGLNILCIQEGDVDCVVTVGSEKEEAKLVIELVPDVILIDISIFQTSIATTTKQLKEA